MPFNILDPQRESAMLAKQREHNIFSLSNQRDVPMVKVTFIDQTSKWMSWNEYDELIGNI